MKDLPNLIEKFEHLEKQLNGNSFLLNNELSIADLSACMLIENSQICSDLINVNEYSNIVLWIDNIKEEVGMGKWGEVMSFFNENMKK